MLKLITLLITTSLTLVACSSAQDATTPSAELPISDIFIDEGGPGTPDELVRESSVIVKATLVDIVANPELRNGPNEDEPGAEYVEVADLLFEVTDAYKGDPGSEITIDFWAYEVENIDGKPGERVATLVVQGISFSLDDVGDEFVLFLAEFDGKLDLVSVSSGIARVLPDGELTATSSTGLVRTEEKASEVSGLIADLSANQ